MPIMRIIRNPDRPLLVDKEFIYSHEISLEAKALFLWLQLKERDKRSDPAKDWRPDLNDPTHNAYWDDVMGLSQIFVTYIKMEKILKELVDSDLIEILPNRHKTINLLEVWND